MPVVYRTGQAGVKGFCLMSKRLDTICGRLPERVSIQGAFNGLGLLALGLLFGTAGGIDFQHCPAGGGPDFRQTQVSKYTQIPIVYFGVTNSVGFM